jgi:hypothetical protein
MEAQGRLAHAPFAAGKNGDKHVCIPLGRHEIQRHHRQGWLPIKRKKMHAFLPAFIHTS